MDHQHLSAPTSAQISHGRRLIAAGYVRRAPQPEPSDLAVAICVAQRMLTIYSDVGIRDLGGLNQAYGAITESLRILLRALGAEAVDAR